MTAFQWIATCALGALLTWEIQQAARGRNHSRFRVVRCAAWIVAGLAIVYPNTTTMVAQSVGIQRGADLVSYLGVLTLLVVAFLGYERYVRLQEQVTVLVRRLAILEAHKASPGPNPLNSPGDRQP